MSNYVERCIELCKQKNPGEVEFHQTVEEVLSSSDSGYRTASGI